MRLNLAGVGKTAAADDSSSDDEPVAAPPPATGFRLNLAAVSTAREAVDDSKPSAVCHTPKETVLSRMQGQPSADVAPASVAAIPAIRLPGMPTSASPSPPTQPDDAASQQVAHLQAVLAAAQASASQQQVRAAVRIASRVAAIARRGRANTLLAASRASRASRERRRAAAPPRRLRASPHVYASASVPGGWPPAL